MTLTELINTPDAKRDENWEDQFLHAITDSNLKLISDGAQQGPDGWPYFLVETGSDANESAQKMIHWLSSRGIGLAVNPQKEFPDFILTYGMLWSFRETGRFIHRNLLPDQGPNKAASGKVEFSKESLMAGEPHPKYLPDYVRKILKDFFIDQGVLNPKLSVLTVDSKNFDLAFSLESLGNPKESEWEGIGEALSWFLPTHYSVLLISEKGLPPFFAL